MIAFDKVEADLGRHAAEKVQRSLNDILQLVDDPEQKMRIALFAASACIGAAGAFLVMATSGSGKVISEDDATVAILNRLIKHKKRGSALR